jgi:hypothetical protein
MGIEDVKIRELNLDMIAPRTKDMNDINKGGSKIVVIGKPGCFALGTEVMKFDGSIVKVEDVITGDVMMGDDSTPRNVLDICRGTERMYNMVPHKGDTFTVNENHILSLKCTGYNQHKKGSNLDITVKDFLQTSKTFQDHYKWYRTAVDFPTVDLDLDPYLLGYWLGDGTSTCAQITTADKEVVEEFSRQFEEQSLILNKSSGKNQNSFLNSLRRLDVLRNKHVPATYKVNSRENRLEILAGLLDSDGYYDVRGHGFDFIHKREKLLDDAVFLARSLGFSAYKTEYIKRCTNSPGHVGTYYRCFISGDVSEIPCRILRKQSLERPRQKDVLVTGFSLEEIGVDNYYGFELDGNNRFLGHDFSVLHNTGKSTLLKSLMYAKKHIFPTALVMSGSEENTPFYKHFIPDIFIHNQYDEEVCKNFVMRQKHAKDHLPNAWAMLLLDDCTDNKAIFNSGLQQGLFKRGRHMRLFYILSLQYALDIRPDIRVNIDGVFILNERNKNIRKKLYENFAGNIPTFEIFCELMNDLTEDYTAIYIDNSGMRNDWWENVYYYKPPRTPDFKFGSKDYWKFNDVRRDPNYKPF